jgi:regulator of protease activity HflC (stomatin/prohibitin superfamily)
MIPNGVGIAFAAAFVLFIVVNSVRILPEYERGVVFRLGRLRPMDYGPGVFFLIPIVDRMVRVSLRTIVHDVPPQDIITRDNVSVKVNAVVYFRVMNPRKLLSQRDKLNLKLQADLDRDTDPWGIKVSKVEVKHVDLPVEMQRAMARQAEAEREKRAKIIHASGEFEASAQLALAADVMGKNPVSLQLRYLQTLTEIGSEKNSTIIFPVPVDLLRGLLAAPK